MFWSHLHEASGRGNATHTFLTPPFCLSDLCLVLLDLGQENHQLLKMHHLGALERQPMVERALEGTQGLHPQELYSKAGRSARRREAQRKQVKKKRIAVLARMK